MLTDADRMHTVIKYVVLTDSVDAMRDTRQYSTHHSNAKVIIIFSKITHLTSSYFLSFIFIFFFFKSFFRLTNISSSNVQTLLDIQ